MRFLTLAFLGLFFFAVPAHAASYVLKGAGGEIVSLESAPDIGTDAYLIKIEGADSPWDGKVFVVQKETTSGQDRYGFEYEVELSSGPKRHSYQLLLKSGQTLIEGSAVDTYDLYLPGKAEPLELAQDRALSEAFEKGSLAGSYKQAPYSPKVE